MDRYRMDFSTTHYHCNLLDTHEATQYSGSCSLEFALSAAAQVASLLQDNISAVVPDIQQRINIFNCLKHPPKQMTIASPTDSDFLKFMRVEEENKTV